MSKMVRWLYAESERWVREGLIGADQAAGIRALYPVPRAARPWAILIFSGLGAVIVGLGVILLFAYNWHAMPKAAKLATVFVSLAALHGAGIWLHQSRTRYRAIGETITVAGTMFFGAGIWLVAQVYHIAEHFPNAFLIWGLGAALLAWALPSIFQAMMAAALFCIWAGTESAAFHDPMHLALVLLLGGLLPLAYRQRSLVLLTSLIVATGVGLAFVTAACGGGRMTFLVLLALSVLAMAAGMLHESFGRFTEAGPVYRGLGMATYLVLVYVLAFPDAAREILQGHWTGDSNPLGLTYWGGMLVAAVAAWAMVPALYLRRRSHGGHLPSPDLCLPPLALVMAYLLTALGTSSADKWLVAVPFNLVFLAHAISLMAQGVRRSELRAVVLGTILLVALTGARYADLFESLLTRGLVFLTVGGCLFAEGVLYARGRRLKEGG